MKSDEVAFWEKLDKDRIGVHYSVLRKASGVEGMDALRTMFPNAEADYMNFALFSTSGVHGTYNTIEAAERHISGEDSEGISEVTFVVVHPRMVAIRYGTCNPANQADIDYLKRLRESSHKAVASIGVDDELNPFVPPDSDDLLQLLEDMARQHCCLNAKTYEVDSGAISTNADVLELLARHGRFVIHRSFGRMVCGHWPEDADKYKPPVRDWDADERRAREIAASMRSADQAPPPIPLRKVPDLFVELSKLEVAFGDAKVRTVTDVIEDSAGASGK